MKNNQRNSSGNSRQKRMPVPQQSTQSNTQQSIKYQLNTDEIIENIEHILKNEVKVTNENGEKVWESRGDQLLNDDGINSIIMELRGRLNKMFALSDISEDDINVIANQTGQNVIEDLKENWDRYDVKSPSAASKILHLVSDAVYVTLMKAKNGTFLKYLGTTHQIQEVTQSVQQRKVNDENSGVMGKVKNALFG